ncbi:MAG: STAS domain-containing protein [Candidatus Omnitrophota bacterium]|jgi:anti-anti-sigma factor
MEIKTTTQGGATIIKISGSLDGNTVNDAQEKILPILTSKMSMLIDLKDCSYISSAGLRLLLMAAKQLSTQGGILLLSGLCDEIKDVMEMTGFSNFFRTFDSIPAALKALEKEA